MDFNDPVPLYEVEREFAYLKVVIKKKIGFNCEYYKEPHLKRRLAVRLRANQSRSYREYAEVLLRDESEQQKLKDTLTVNVTELFRNPETYEGFKKTVLTELITSRAEYRTLKIWSAGCSDGEEPYSIAIILREFLGRSAGEYNISILGTDIDDDSLRKAQEAVYRSKQLEKVNKQRLKRFFTKIDDDTYQINDDIRNLVTFRNHDLISGPKLHGFDVIFCRNVMIYFRKSLQERLYLNFYDALYERGYFIMGKTETLIGPASELFYPVDVRERIYQKRRKRDE